MRRAWVAALCLLVAGQAWGGVLRGSGGAADFCTAQAWDTLTSFRLDFDHTTDERTACLASGTETGAWAGTAGTETPSLVSPGSGAKAMLNDAAGEQVNFSNSAPYMRSTYGEAMVKIRLSADNTSDAYGLYFVGVAGEDRIQVGFGVAGRPTVTWEDNNGGAFSVEIVSATYDVDAHYGDWAQIHVKWDTTRCTQGDGNCNDAGEDELAIRCRYDDNGDGDFGDGTAEDWSAWTHNQSATDQDLGVWAAEPTTNEISVGSVGATGASMWVDDVEISYAQPTW